MALLFIVAWPISKLLDCLLGHEHSTFFRRAGTSLLTFLLASIMCNSRCIATNKIHKQLNTAMLNSQNNWVEIKCENDYNIQNLCHAVFYWPVLIWVHFSKKYKVIKFSGRLNNYWCSNMLECEFFNSTQGCQNMGGGEPPPIFSPKDA